MTTPPPPFDPANTLLAPAPSHLTTGILNTPDGQRLAVTIRTNTTTTTAILTGDDARTWAHHLTTAAATISTTRLIIAAGTL